MKSRRRFFFLNKSAFAILATSTVMLLAFQNCGKLSSNSSQENSGYGSSSFDDADIAFSKTEFVLTESANDAASDSIVISLKPGVASSRISYQLVQSESTGDTPTTVLGTLNGSATIGELTNSAEIRVLSGSNTILKEAKTKTLLLIVKKETPSEATFIVPIRVVLLAEPPPPPPPPPDVPVTPANATATQRQERCVNFATQRPSFVTLFNDTTFNLGFGLSAVRLGGNSGPYIEGHSVSDSISVTVNKNITDLTNYNLWNCDQNGVLEYRVVTEVVTGDAGNNAKPAPAFTYALDGAGALRSYADAASRNTLASDSYALNGNNNNNNNNDNSSSRTTITPGTTNLTASMFFAPRYTSGNNSQKCVAGTVWLRVTVQAIYSGRNNAPYTTKVSDPQYVKLNISNNCWTEHRLRKTGNVPYDTQINMGTDVAISGVWAASLAEGDFIDASKQNVGAIYMFKKENGAWVQKGTKITIPELLTGESISNIDLRGDVLVAGVPKRGRGTVYVFRRNGDNWILSHTLACPFPSGTPKFGAGLAISSQHIAVGAPQVNAVYLYPYTPTTVGSPVTIQGMPSMLNDLDQAVVDPKGYFGGGAIAFNESRSHLIIGAPTEPGVEANTEGNVYVYNISNPAAITLFKKFKGTQIGDRFGSNIVVNDKKLAIASEVYANAGGTAVGRLDYYADYTVAEAPPTTVPPIQYESKLPITNSWIGTVKNSNIGGGAVITANGIFVATPNSVLVDPPGVIEYYPFADGTGTTFGTMMRLRAYNESIRARFGWSMAADGNNIMVGAKTKADDGVGDSGAAFIYEAR